MIIGVSVLRSSVNQVSHGPIPREMSNIRCSLGSFPITSSYSGKYADSSLLNRMPSWDLSFRFSSLTILGFGCNLSSSCLRLFATLSWLLVVFGGGNMGSESINMTVGGCCFGCCTGCCGVERRGAAAEVAFDLMTRDRLLGSSSTRDSINTVIFAFLTLIESSSGSAISLARLFRP